MKHSTVCLVSLLSIAIARDTFSAEVPQNKEAEPTARTGVTVRGAVRYPGVIKWKEGLALNEALSSVGCSEPSGLIRVIRNEQVLRFSLKAIKRGKIAEPILQPGDVVEVP